MAAGGYTMERILSDPLDISLLDAVVQTFYTSAGSEQKRAADLLAQFQAQADSWKKVDAILLQSNYMHTKYLALQILENLIKTMWKALPTDQRRGIKDYIVAVLIETSSTEQSLEKNKTYLSKLNIVLVQILKHEWPQHWPTFIPEIVSSSRANLALCENNMMILKLLSEEIFDFSAEQMTSQKAKTLKNQMCGEFSEIFQLCHEILDNAQKSSLIKATLETLLRFLNWIPLGYIFETNLIDTLQSRFLEVPLFRNVTLKCLTEIGGLSCGPEYNEKFLTMFRNVLNSIHKLIPVSTNICEVYENSNDHDQQFIQNLALFLTSFLGVHVKLVEQSKEFLITAHMYLIRISQVNEREIFKVVLEYWTKLVAELYDEIQSIPSLETPLLNLNPPNYMNGASLRKHLYHEVLSNLRIVMIERMVKPEEVLIVENDEGEVVREFVKESDTITLYKSMREVLVYLTHLDVDDTEAIMSEKLARQMDGSEWSWENINKLCWAMGSISGAMNEETEKRFLVMVIKELLNLTEMKRGKDNKAIVASNIMYIVGQYPRFLKAHWKFLKTVVNKLFEFMHETHEGVQDMACDTFIKISQKCKRHFIMQQPGEVMPFIEEILASIATITSDLSPQQIHTFYEAVGHMISAQPNKQIQERLIVKLMELPNSSWDSLMQQAAHNVDVLGNAENIKLLGNIMKTNVAACTSVGAPFIVQIGRIYVDLLGLYKAVSELISEAVRTQGEIATKTPRVRGMRTIKKEILKLIDLYIVKAEDLTNIVGTLIPPLFDAILGDYLRNVDEAKDAEVLSVVATIIAKLGTLVNDRIPLILDATFSCTLSMISKNFEDYPEHRVTFYKMLQSINQYCFQSLIDLSGPQFKLFLDSIIWGLKHPIRDISDLGLTICLDLLNNFSKMDPTISNAFFQTYFLNILQDIFYVLTNTFHKSGFKLQVMILMQMFQMVDSIALLDPSQSRSNPDYLREHVGNLLLTAFPHLQKIQVDHFLNGLFSLNRDFLAFKNHIRDFLIQLKEFAGDELFLEEKEAEAERLKNEAFQAALKIPGMVKPHDRPDDGMMD